MRTRSIEIDEDIFQHLKNEAEPFVDTPNTVLRRLLLDGKIAHEPKESRREVLSTLPEFPTGTPATLCEILSVVKLVDSGHSRPEATQLVAARYHITQQTVLDKYTRQLALTAAEFDTALAEPGRRRLFEKLSRRVPGHDDLIRHHLNASI